MQRLPQVTELLRKYNRQLEGPNPEIRKKKFPIPEGEVKVKVTGVELAKNPELAELLRAGTFLRIDESGNVVPNLAMTTGEANKYNKRFTEAIVDQIKEKEEKGGLPEGHVRETQDARGRTIISGRYLEPSIIDAIEAKGTWNKEQIATLRRINDNLMNKGGNEFFLSYFKASSKRGKAGRYVNASVENLTEVPYGIELTQKGNLIIRTVSVNQLSKNVDKLVREQSAEVARLYGPDMNAAKTRLLQDLDTYHRNHAEGRPGEDGIGVDKKNLINSAFGQGRKEQADLNPWLAQLGKKQPRPVYRSRRIDRIGKADQLSGKRFVDYEKVARNLLPAGDELYLPPMTEGELTTLRNLVQKNPEGFTVTLKANWADKGYVVAPEKRTEAFIKPDKFNERSLENYIYEFESIFDRDGAHLGGWYDKMTDRFVLDVVFPLEDYRSAIEVALWGDQDAVFSLNTFKEIRTKDKNGRPIIPKGFGESARSIIQRKPDNLSAFAEEAWRRSQGIRQEGSEGVFQSPARVGKDTGPQATKATGGVDEGRLLLPAPEGTDAQYKISTRNPTAVNRTADPVTNDLVVGLDSILSDPAIAASYADAIKRYPGMKNLKGTPEQTIEGFIDFAVNNLLWLYDKVPPGTRIRMGKWYEGGRKIAERFADEYQTSTRAVAGVIAAESPKTDWYINVDKAKRTLDIFFNQQNTVFDGKMVKQFVKTTKPKDKAWARKLAKGYLGKKFKDLDEVGMAAFIRAFDEVNNPRDYQMISPEGDFLGIAKTKKGENAVSTPGSEAMRIKSLRILMDDSKANLSESMGAAHKIRNFFNNILLPMLDGDSITVDTHAVAAALLRPLAAADLEVSNMLGTIGKEKGSVSIKNSSVEGVRGLYGIYAEAYRRAAKERNVMPRQMQSITWEAIRGLYPKEIKRAEFKQTINNLFKDYENGKISIDDVREKIFKKAGGIDTPTWAKVGDRSRDTRPGGRKTPQGSRSAPYEGSVFLPNVSRFGVPAGAGRVRASAGELGIPGGLNRFGVPAASRAAQARELPERFRSR